MSSRAKLWTWIVSILVFALIASLFDLPNTSWPGGIFKKLDYKLGLDLKGGAHLTYQADMSKVSPEDRTSAIDGVRDVIERRVNAFGVSEPLVQTSVAGGKYRLIVELAGVFDVQEAIKQIGLTPLLEFKEQNPNTNAPLTAEQQKKLDELNGQAKEQAERVLKEVLVKPDQFEALAKEHSEDSTRDAGGDLGFAKKGAFVPEFEKAIFETLKAGEITQTLVESQFGWHIIQKIEETGEGDTREVRARHILITKKNENDVRAPQEPWLNTQLSGKQLKRASIQFDQQFGEPSVSLEFNDEGAKLFSEITGRNVGKPVAIFLDNLPLSVPKVQQKIDGGQAQITGRFTLKEAKDLVARLNAGALPVPIALITQSTVGPTLGAISLQQSLRAGLIGFLLVVLFMILYYRLAGVIATVALGMYAVFSLFVFQLFGVTLTLAGIAGLILSIGMAVDANVLIFERMKEELRGGKLLAVAVEEGFKRAWTSIRDSNISSLITCAILMWFGTSIVKGFAVTLAIGIVISMFSAITLSKQFLKLIVRESLRKRIFFKGVT